MDVKLEDLNDYVESPTFREYLLWKNQNINVGNLLSKLKTANSSGHFFGILKAALYDSNRFQFQDYTFQFIDCIFSDKKLLDSNEILIYQPITKIAEFDIVMCDKRIFELQNTILAFGKKSKITHDETEYAINPCSWIQKNKGINIDFLDICFRNKVDKKVLKFIHYVETYMFMSQINPDEK